VIFSVANRRLEDFATRLEDAGAVAAIEAALRHEERPGPIVSVIGASQRGKSVLFNRLAGRASFDEDLTDPGTSVTLAYGAAWSGVAHRLLSSPARHYPIAGEPPASILLIDTPGLDSTADRDAVKEIVALSDLVLMVVQVTFPAGDEEVTFALEHLTETPAILVVTKADLADEDDFAEGLESILEVYGAVPWREVLVSGRSEAGETAEGRQGLSGLLEWWQARGPDQAATARVLRRTRLRQTWIEQARAFMDREETAAAAEHSRLLDELQADEALRQALDLREKLRQGTAAAGRQAVGMYGDHLRELHTQLASGLEDCLREDAASVPDPNRTVAALQSVVEGWDRETRARLRKEMEPVVARLERQHQEFTRRVGQLCVKLNGTVPVPLESRSGPVEGVGVRCPVALEAPGLDLSMEEQLRPALASAVSGLGSFALIQSVMAGLLGILAPPLALGAGILMCLTTSGAMVAGNRQKVQAAMRQSLGLQFQRVQQDLRDRYRRDWEQLADTIAAQLAPYEHYLMLYQAAAAHVEVPNGRARFQELSRRKEHLAGLRQELAVLTEAVPPEEGAEAHD
jgi:tRNA U34 5-carboxymethylaminomethyl modifying GTPase MnmE/TrmE